MRVQTTWTIDAPRDAVWPLLCDSTMELRPSLLFLLGVPRPRSCRLPSGAAGVGQTRECVSDKGTIKQRILTWDAGRCLRFEMEETDLPFRRYVQRIVDTFDLDDAGPCKTRIRRTTEVAFAGRFPMFKAAAAWLGLKLVHRYVFRNWAMLAERAVRGRGGQV